jgi:hypothetical protein
MKRDRVIAIVLCVVAATLSIAGLVIVIASADTTLGVLTIVMGLSLVSSEFVSPEESS